MPVYGDREKYGRTSTKDAGKPLSLSLVPYSESLFHFQGPWAHLDNPE